MPVSCHREIRPLVFSTRVQPGGNGEFGYSSTIGGRRNIASSPRSANSPSYKVISSSKSCRDQPTGVTPALQTQQLSYKGSATVFSLKEARQHTPRWPSKGFTSSSEAAGLCHHFVFSRSVSDVELVDSLSSAEDCERSGSVMASWLL